MVSDFINTAALRAGSQPNSNSHGDGNGHFHANTHGHLHSDGDGYLYPDPYCDGDLHTNSDTNCNNNCDSNTNGDSDSYAYTTMNYGLVCASQNFNGITTQNLRANVSGLAAGTTYHFRIVATNASGTAYGSDRTFTTRSTGGR